MCCLVENYQTEDGLLLPEVLWPFMGGRKVIKFKFGLNSKGNLEPLNKPAPSAGPTQQEAPKKKQRQRKRRQRNKRQRKRRQRRKSPRRKSPRRKSLRRRKRRLRSQHQKNSRRLLPRRRRQ